MKEARALYPTDFSEDSLQRIKNAAEYCMQNGAELVVLYAYRLLNGTASNPNRYSLKKQLDSKASETFKTIEETLLKKLPISYKMLSEVGFVDDRIAHSIEQYNIDNILLCQSLHDHLESRIVQNPEGKKELFNLPVIEV